jgi:hypothetical protein
MLQTAFILASAQSLTVGYCEHNSEFYGCINDVGLFYQTGGHHLYKVCSWKSGIKFGECNN